MQYTVTEGGDVVIWLPNPKAVGQLVASGTLAGEVDEDRGSTIVTLTGPPSHPVTVVDLPRAAARRLLRSSGGLGGGCDWRGDRRGHGCGAALHSSAAAAFGGIGSG